MLVYSGFIYRLKKCTKSVKYWSCNSDGCLANIHTSLNDHFRKTNGHHYHVPAPEQIELRDLKSKVKERVLTESNAVPKIYEEELARCHLSSVALTLAPAALEASMFLLLKCLIRL